MAELHPSWEKLLPEVQRKLAIRARNRARKQLAEFPNVTGVGVGIRYLAGKATCHQCVTVQVRKKWKRKQKRKGSIPESLIVYLHTRSGRRRIKVPVDIIVAETPVLQAGGESCVSWLGNEPIPGAVCCLVRRGDDPMPHVLSCHHVIYLTQRFPNPDEGNLYRYSLDVLQQNIGPPVDFEPLANTDAAIVPWTAAVPGDELVHGTRLHGWADEESDIPIDCWIVTPRGSIAARYASLLPEVIGGYHGGGWTYRFPVVLRCECKDGRTIGGDSGSPVIDAARRLIGMHIAGFENFSYILPMYEVLTRFDPMLTPVLQLP